MVRRMGSSGNRDAISEKKMTSWFQRKWTGRIIKLIIAIIIICCGREYLLYENWTFLEIRDNKVPIKILIPNEIAQTRNCVEFNTWQSGVLPEEYQQKCPWE